MGYRCDRGQSAVELTVLVALLLTLFAGYKQLFGASARIFDHTTLSIDRIVR